MLPFTYDKQMLLVDAILTSSRLIQAQCLSTCSFRAIPGWLLAMITLSSHCCHRCCRLAGVPIATANVSDWRAAAAARNGTRRLLQTPVDSFAVDLWTELIPSSNLTAAQVSA